MKTATRNSWLHIRSEPAFHGFEVFRRGQVAEPVGHGHAELRDGVQNLLVRFPKSGLVPLDMLEIVRRRVLDAKLDLAHLPPRVGGKPRRDAPGGRSRKRH